MNSTICPPAAPAPALAPIPKHQMALMIWLAVFPTLVVLQLLLHEILAGTPMILRTLILASITVPIVVFALMPPLQRLRTYLIR
jgi:antibiotic biosynthesis monooxygenase (ABM) superfamily enzyme